MKRTFLKLVAVLICALAGIPPAQAHPQHETAAQLRARLASATSPRDSIRMLYDILDVLPLKEQPRVAMSIDSIAERIGDNATRLDLARIMAAIYIEDSDLARVEARVLKIPESKEQKETMLFVKLKRLSASNRHKSEEERQKEIIRILSEDVDKKGKTPADQLLDLFSLVEYLRNDASGDMLKEYLDRLSVLASSPYFKINTISLYVQSEAARIYSDADDADKAVAADHKVLQNIAGLEKSYADRGRHYRNYNVSKLHSYMRLLRNYEALRPGEVAEINAKVMDMAARNIDVSNELQQRPDYKAYYAVATGDYPTAIPLLRQMLAENRPLAVRKQLLEALVKASEAAGDDKTKIEALTEYTAILEQLNKLKAAERYRELQIRYDVQDLKNRNSQLELENRNDEILSARRIMTFVIVAFALMFLILIISLYHWGRFKKNSSTMGEVVDNMHGQRIKLKDEMFDLDTSDPLAFEERMEPETWSKRLRRRGARWDNISLFMTRSIINDLLYISCIGHNSMSRHIEVTPLGKLLRETEAAATAGNAPHSNIVVEYPAEDISIVTDRECLAALIENIFDLAISYSPERTVEISLRPAEQYVDFVITTVGAKTAGPDDPQLFDDFSLAKQLLRRNGAGLFICRMISMLLQCRFIPDTTYAGGCRYVFRTPRKLDKGLK